MSRVGVEKCQNVGYGSWRAYEEGSYLVGLREVTRGGGEEVTCKNGRGML